MITLHHLQRSQSERIVWLLEELGLPYELKIYQRDRQTLLAPPELKALHPTGASPVITDGPVTLAESGAIVEYILTKYATGKLTVPVSAPNYADYLYWLHYANGHLQPSLMRNMYFSFAGVEPSSNQAVKSMLERTELALRILDDRLKQTDQWLAGEEFTAADIMTVFCVTTARLFIPFSLDKYDGISAWVQRAGQRPAYKKMIEKGESGETRGVLPVLGKEAPPFIGRG